MVTACMMGAAALALIAGSAMSGRGGPPTGTDRQPPTGDVRRPVACSMEARVLSVRVLDRRTGAPVEGATIRATRTRSGTVLADTRAIGLAGDYLIAMDGSVAGLSQAGEPLAVEVRLGRRRVRATYVIGLTTDGCHIELRQGPGTLRL